MDFVVYPPHFADPDRTIMTQFVRDVRSMLDEMGKKQNRRLELMARLPCYGARSGLGLEKLDARETDRLHCAIRHKSL